MQWTKFMFGYRPWNESVRRLLPAAAALGLPVTVPSINELYAVGNPVQHEPWWEVN